MPIYEFHCEQCEQDSEVLVRTSDWKGAKCPHCGSTRLEKKLSTFASSTAGGSEPSSCGAGSGGGGGGCCACASGRPHSH